ncbi:MAG: hypothetical protein Q7W55_00670 [Pseudohongiella sp.]|nr:hypothetical protein [Pseudohongiella sp.]
MTIDDMRERFRMLLASAGQHENATDALARRINRCLMLFDDRLYDLGSGDYVHLAAADTRDAIRISDAAAKLLQGYQPDTECVLLLLPPSEFLVNPVSMPGLSPDAMRAALKLQALTQLPEFDHVLNLSLTGNAGGNSAQSLVWWIPDTRTSELFNAFATRSIFLAAVLPRPVWLMAGLQRTLPLQDFVLQESDGHMLTVVAAGYKSTGDDRAETLSCLQTASYDIQDADLYAEWQKELARAGISGIDYTVSTGDEYMRLLRQHNLQDFDYRTATTGAFPAPALSARHQLDRGRRRGAAIKAVAAALVLVMLPFVYQSWQLNRAQNQLAEIRELSAEARQDQAAVREFETQWGVLTEFPDQDIGATMLELQQVINPGVLAMFAIDKGFISIEGQSQDPQNVLEQLEQNALFTEVDFARATNNNRYFIDLRLTTVNFPAYQERHFPERR